MRSHINTNFKILEVNLKIFRFEVDNGKSNFIGASYIFSSEVNYRSFKVMSNINCSSLSAVINWCDFNVNTTDIKARIVNNKACKFLSSFINRRFEIDTESKIHAFKTTSWSGRGCS